MTQTDNAGVDDQPAQGTFGTAHHGGCLECVAEESSAGDLDVIACAPGGDDGHTLLPCTRAVPAGVSAPLGSSIGCVCGADGSRGLSVW